MTEKSNSKNIKQKAKKPSKVNKKKSNTKIIVVAIFVILLLLFLLLLKSCSIKQYTVKFDSDGGDVVDTLKVKENKQVKRPKDPIKEGYIFDGWYYKNKLFDFNTKITKNITLKAHWKESLIGLNLTSLNMVVGKNDKLEITKLPDGLSLDDLEWISSDEKIVTVDENGNVKALKSGEVTITVKTKDGKYSASCKITVTEEEIEIDSMTINGSQQVTVGGNIKLTVSFKPDNATNQELKWESSNSSIASVDENGIVRGLRAGTVTIKVTSKNGKTATKKITVKTSTTQNKTTNQNSNSNNNKQTTQSKPTEILPNAVSISGLQEVYEGNTIQLTANITPTNATNKSVTWSSNDSGIAKVDNNGKVTGVKAGTTTITVRTSNGKTATHQVTVKEKEASYVITLTAKRMSGTNAITQYDFKVTKNGSEFTGYTSFTYNNHTIFKTDGSVQVLAVDSNVTTAYITFSDGSSKEAQVIIN